MKNIKALILTLIVSLFVLSFAVSAANAGDLAVAVGRGTVVSSNGLVATFEPLSDGEGVKDMFCVPVVVNESTYVPVRYIFEKMGVDVYFDAVTKNTTFERANRKPIMVYGLAKEATGCKKIELGTDTITFYPEKGVSVTEAVDVYNYLGMNYVPARYLERFGVLIKWDAANSVVYMGYGDTVSAIKNFELVYYADSEEEKQRALNNYFNKVTSAPTFKAAFDEYLSINADSSNNQNGGYIQPFNGKNYFPNINIEKSGWFTKLGQNSRQACHATDGAENYMYYVDRTTQGLRRYTVGAENKDEAVALPAVLKGKKITHLTYYDGNIFYVAYDNANEGGHIYMSRVGNEAASTVKITKDKAWNFYINPAYKLYFVNFGEGYRLTSIDLRSINNTQVFVDTPMEGVLSDIVNFTPMQTFSFDCQNATDYYYIDIVTGSLIKSSRNHNTGTEVLSQGKNGALRHFLNVATVGGKNSVVYVEYPNGKNGDLSKSNIMMYNIEAKTEVLLYSCDFTVNGICILGGEIYFTDTQYSALYKLENAGSNLKVKITQIGA